MGSPSTSNLVKNHHSAGTKTLSKQSEHDEVTPHSYLDWVTSEHLRWRPSFGKYPLEWKDLLLIKGRSWVATRAESGYNIIDEAETLRRLRPVIENAVGQNALEELRDIEKKGYSAVSEWVDDLYRAAAYAHMSHIRTLEVLRRAV